MSESTLINGETWNDSFTLGKKSGTKVTLLTNNNYVDKNIELTIGAQEATPVFAGGALNNKSASAIFTNLTTSNNNSSGVLIQTIGHAGRDAVCYNGAVNGWVTASDNAVVSSGVTASDWNGSSYYVTGVTLGNNKSFNITVPDGNSTVTHTISVDSSGNVSGLGNGAAAVTIWEELDSNGGYIKHIQAVDLSNDTVTADKLLYGYTAHNSQGQLITGTAVAGSGSAISVVDSLDANGGTIRTITGVSLAGDTVTAAHLESGYTAHDALGNAITGTLSPSASDILVVTLSYNEQTDMWEPNKTYAQISAANSASKTIVVNMDISGSIGSADGSFYNSQFNYWVRHYSSNDLDTITEQSYTLSSSGIVQNSSYDYIIPTGTKNITANGTAIDVTNYATVDVAVSGNSPVLQTVTKSYTPTESQQTETITPGSNYDGISEVSVTIGAISSSYIGSGITQRSSTDLSALDATVTVPAGYYSTQATKSVSSMTLPTSAAASATSGYTSKATISPSTSDQYINIGTGYNNTASYYKINAMSTMTLPTSTSSSATSGYSSKATISRSTSDQYINIPTGYNSAGAYYKINAVANGSATGPSSLSGSSATVSTGTNTITLTKTGVTTTPTVSAGYVSSATASTATVTLTASVTTKAATTYHPSTSDQTISSGTYTTGTQTIKAVTVSGLAANKVLSGTTVKIGDSTDDDCVTSVSGSVTFQTIYSGSSAPSSSTGVNGDVYIQT